MTLYKPTHTNLYAVRLDDLDTGKTIYESMYEDRLYACIQWLQECGAPNMRILASTGRRSSRLWFYTDCNGHCYRG